MQTFVMLTRLAPDAVKSPRALEDLERKAVEAVKAKCPRSSGRTAVMGPYDDIDILEAPDLANAAQVSAQVRAFGHAHTEIWGAMEWARFKEAVRALA
ncbi:MAG: GYD domain-containing protein [Hyphomicrobiaceae bacterium]